MILGRFQNGMISGCGFCQHGLKHYHVRTYVYISHTHIRTRYWGSRQTLKLYHVHVHARTPVIGSPLLPSWETLHRPVARPLSARQLFYRGSNSLPFNPLPMSSVTSALQVPISAVYVSLSHRLGMSFCLLSSRLFRSALLGFVQWLRGFGIFCSDVFRSADFCSGCRHSIGLGKCWEWFGIRLGCPRLSSPHVHKVKLTTSLKFFKAKLTTFYKMKLTRSLKKFKLTTAQKSKLKLTRTLKKYAIKCAIDYCKAQCVVL